MNYKEFTKTNYKNFMGNADDFEQMAQDHLKEKLKEIDALIASDTLEQDAVNELMDLHSTVTSHLNSSQIEKLQERVTELETQLTKIITTSTFNQEKVDSHKSYNLSRESNNGKNIY